MDILFGALQNATKGTESYKSALAAVNDKYGEYLPNLLEEAATLEEIRKAHNGAKEAMVDRLTETAKHNALLEENNKFVTAQADLQTKLYKKVQKENGLEVAAVATTNFKEMAEQYVTLWENVKRASGHGMDDVTKQLKEQMLGLKTEFADSFLGGNEKLVTDLLIDFRVSKEQLNRNIAEIEAVYKGFQEKANFAVEDDPAKTVFDSSKLSQELKVAEKAYKEWEAFKITSRANELRGEYQHYLDLGESYQDYLETKLDEHKANHAAVMILSKELAGIEAKGIQIAKKEAQELQEQMQQVWDKVLAELDQGMSQQIQSMEKKNTDSLKRYQKEMEAGVRGIAQIASRYASQDELLHAQLKALKNHYKKARLPLDKQYYELRDKIIEEHLAREVTYISDTASIIFNEMGALLGQFDDRLGQAMNSMSNLL